MLEWTEEAYGTGHVDIDAQHRELFERVNAVIAAGRLPHPDPVVDVTLNFLTSYVIRHFLHEERVMADLELPGQVENKEGHMRFAVRLGELKQRFRVEGASPEYMADLERFLVGWLSAHVEVIDVQNLRKEPGSGRRS